jgi:3-methyladenine DNA glycosylase AlkD
MSEASAEASAFVSAHRAEAMALGVQLADLTEEPEVLLVALREGLGRLADPVYTNMAERVSPATAAPFAVRGPLVAMVQRPLEKALQEGSSISALRLAQRLIQSDDRDLRLFALPCLRRALEPDPEQTWQLLRRMGRIANDWIEVDSLADIWSRGVLAEQFRWAELEQLLYSEHTFERRLVAATLATIPHRVPTSRRDELRPAAVERALEMVRLLMGDAQVMVQKALSWAIREWARVDADRTLDLLQRETAIAVRETDGARAWVVRDSLPNLPPAAAEELRAQLTSIRRDRNAPSTSIASGLAANFAAALTASTDVVVAQGDRYTRSHA